MALLLLCALSGYALDISWPQELQPPERDTASSLQHTSLSTKQIVYRQTVKSSNVYSLVKSENLTRWEQNVRYDLFYDRVLNMLNQYLDASGAVYHTLPQDTSVRLGLSYSPWVVYNRRNFSGSSQGSFDIGPLISINYQGVPAELRAGFSGRTWGLNLPAEVATTSLQNFYHDQGVFGWFSLGDSSRPVYKSPLYFQAHGYGRRMSTSNLLSTIASALIAYDFGTSDSLLLRITDSLILGNDGVLEDATDGKSLFVNTPSRNGHIISGLGGIKGASRFHLIPALFGGFSLHQNRYPDQPTDLLDRRNTQSSFALALSSDDGAPLVYEGGLGFSFEQETKLPGIQFSGILTSNNTDSLKIHNNDYNGYSAAFKQKIGKYFQSGAGGAYTFSISRATRRYPNFFKSGLDTIRNTSENHWLDQVHSISIIPYSSDAVSAEFTGEYEQSHLIYLKKEHSASNTKNSIYRLGLSLSVKPHANLLVTDQIATDVKMSAADFPMINPNNFRSNFPYGRTASNTLGSTFDILPWATLLFQNNETFWDEGYRFDPLFVDTLLDSTITQKSWFYAIDRTSFIHEFKLSSKFTIGTSLSLECGAMLGISQFIIFDGNNYVVNALQGQRRITPFLDIVFLREQKIAGNAHIAKTFYRNSESFWDISIAAKVFF